MTTMEGEMDAGMMVPATVLPNEQEAAITTSPARVVEQGRRIAGSPYRHRPAVIAFLLDWAPILLLGLSIAVAGVWRTVESVRAVPASPAGVSAVGPSSNR